MLVCDYIDVTQFDKYIFVFYIRCFENFSSINVTPLILRCCRIVCAECGTVWSGFGGVSECAAGGFVVGVCVCGTVWSGFGGSECAAGGFVVCVCVCVCVSASFEL